MSSLRLQFDKRSRTANIAIERSTGDGSGNTFISLQCRSAEELEGEVRRLKAELDRILDDGRNRFTRTPRPPLFDA